MSGKSRFQPLPCLEHRVATSLAPQALRALRSDERREDFAGTAFAAAARRHFRRRGASYAPVARGPLPPGFDLSVLSVW